MGTRGPIPKPVDKRLGHRSKAEKEAVTRAASGSSEVLEPLPASEDWHPIARHLYDSLAKSGQVEFYEYSDWAYAFYVTEMASRSLFSPVVNAQLVATVTSSLNDLLVSVGSRRRAALELQKKQVEPVDDAKVTRMDAYKRAAGG